MARNAAGVYSLPDSPVVAGTTITAVDENTTRNDMASELTNSLDRNGRGAMLSPLQLADGAVSTPGLTFGTDTNTGLYRVGPDAFSLVANGAAVLAITTAGVAVTGTLSVSGDSTFAGSTMVQNSQSTNYTAVAGDANKHIIHPSSDNNPRTFTIPANASVAYALGTMLTFVNKINTLTIAINSDTLTLVGGSTGSRTLAANGLATAIKISATEWMINGAGIS